MKYNPEIPARPNGHSGRHHRRSIRLKGYDYSQVRQSTDSVILRSGILFYFSRNLEEQRCRKIYNSEINPECSLHPRNRHLGSAVLLLTFFGVVGRNGFCVAIALKGKAVGRNSVSNKIIVNRLCAPLR